MDIQVHYLLMANHSMMQKRIFSSLKSLDLTLGQPKVLEYLSKHDGAIQKDIANGCYIEPASLSNILNGMEKKGLIQRKSNNENRRNVYIFMTEKGKELCQAVKQEIAQANSEALKGFSTEDISTLQNYLSKIKENMEAKDES